MDLQKLFIPANASETWTAIAAIGTLLAVLAALWPEIRGWWNQPKLTVAAELNAETCQLVGPHWYLRLWIANTPGRKAAENVQVFVAALTTVAGDFKPRGIFLPQNLRWTHVDPNGSTFLERINPGMGRHCELGAFLEKPGQAGALNLDLERLPIELPVGVYRLKLMVAGSNANPVTTAVEIAVKGPWVKDLEVMLRERVSLRVV
jgi:hypothetical protein